VIAVTGVAPATGTVTPGIAAILIVDIGGAGRNTAVTTPESAAFVACTNVPATVKKSAPTPVNVQPASGVRVIVATYAVLPTNGLSVGDHATVPVYSAVGVIFVTGVAPATGAVTPAIAAISIVRVRVVGNTAVTTPESAAFVACVDVPATVKKFAATPVNVQSASGVRVIVAVYLVPTANVAGLPLHATVPVYSAVGVIAATGVAPVTGAVTPAIAAISIVVGIVGIGISAPQAIPSYR